jgi:hypothetical protein
MVLLLLVTELGALLNVWALCGVSEGVVANDGVVLASSAHFLPFLDEAQSEKFVLLTPRSGGINGEGGAGGGGLASTPDGMFFMVTVGLVPWDARYSSA